MRISIDALRVIDAIDRTGSFAKAAEELHRVRSAITYTVKKLESDLDVVIFDRSGHKTKLTEAGRVLLKGGRNLLRETLYLEEKVQQAEKGIEPELRIAYNDILPISDFAPLLTAFQKTFPHTSLRFQAERLQGCLDALHSKRVVLSIGITSEQTLDASISTEPFGELSFEFCVAPGHPLATMPDPLTQEQIAQYYSITAFDSSLNLPLLSSGTIESQEKIAVSSIDDKLQLQLLGVGVGYLPRNLCEPYLKTGQLIAKQTTRSAPVATMLLAWRNTHESKALTWFLEQLRSTRD